MPTGVDEKKWEKAKKIADKSDNAPEKGSDDYWAYVRGIYNKMNGKNKEGSSGPEGIEKIVRSWLGPSKTAQYTAHGGSEVSSMDEVAVSHLEDMGIKDTGDLLDVLENYRNPGDFDERLNYFLSELGEERLIDNMYQKEQGAEEEPEDPQRSEELEQMIRKFLAGQQAEEKVPPEYKGMERPIREILDDEQADWSEFPKIRYKGERSPDELDIMELLVELEQRTGHEYPEQMDDVNYWRETPDRPEEKGEAGEPEGVVGRIKRWLSLQTDEEGPDDNREEVMNFAPLFDIPRKEREG